jgi:hypothetical protein
MRLTDAREGSMPARDARSALEVLYNIFGNIKDIGRSEVRLLKADIEEGVAEVKKPVVALGAGLMLAGYAGGLLLVALVFALALVMAMWAAALLVGTFTSIVAALLILRGRRGIGRVKAKSERTIARLRERMQWATHQNRS